MAVHLAPKDDESTMTKLSTTFLRYTISRWPVRLSNGDQQELATIPLTVGSHTTKDEISRCWPISHQVPSTCIQYRAAAGTRRTSLRHLLVGGALEAKRAGPPRGDDDK